MGAWFWAGAQVGAGIVGFLVALAVSAGLMWLVAVACIALVDRIKR